MSKLAHEQSSDSGTQHYDVPEHFTADLLNIMT